MAPPTLSKSSTLPIDTFVVDLLCNVAIAEGFSDCTLTATAGSKHGDGFLSAVARVLITGQRNGAEQSLSVIVKVPPSDAKFREEFGSAASFRSEAHFYDHVAPTFAAFERERGLPAAEAFQLPRCLATRCDDDLQQFAIVLEDLRFAGWRLRDKFLAVDEAHGRRVAEGLARYHGVSMALRDQRPEVFAEFALMENGFRSHVEANPEETKGFFALAWKRAADTMDKVADAALLRKFAAATEDFVAIVQRSLRSDVDESRRVIGHGDFWNNNLMFAYDEAGEPLRVCLFDFQNSKFHSPVLDVVTYLFYSTDKQFRDQHMESFLRHYHDTLAAVVRRLGSDPERLFAWSDFRSDLRQFGVMGAIMAPFMLQVTTADAEDVRRSQEALAGGCTETNLWYSKSTAAVYEERVRDVLRSADECGFFAAYE